jgi:predicted small secreted protein
MALVVLSIGLVGCKTVKEIGSVAGEAMEQAAEGAKDPVKLTAEGRKVEALPLGTELSN